MNELAIPRRRRLTDVLPQITCAVCNKLVNRIEIGEDYESDAFMVRVWCHGDVDTCLIPRCDIEDGMNMNTGTAFGTKRIGYSKDA